MTTLIFDLDGTLLDCRERHYAVYSDALRELAHEPLPIDDYWRHRRAGGSTFDVVRDLPEGDAAQFRVTWMNRIERRDYLTLDKPYRGAETALSELSRNHCLVMLTLRRDADALAWQLTRTRLARYFGEVISPWGGMIPVRKSELLENWSPMEETWAIGDTEADIDLAADIGARCVSLTNGVRNEEHLIRHGAMLLLPSVVAVAELARTLTAAAVEQQQQSAE